MLEQALNWIANHGKHNEIEEHELLYTDKEFKPILPPKANTLFLSSLSGLKTYIDENVDAHERENLLLHVTDYATVCLRGQLNRQTGQRELYAQAQLCLDDFSFDHYYDLEMFIVLLQARFIVTEAQKKVLSIVGNLRHDQSMEASDDGVTQKVVARTGIARDGLVDLPNPIKLKPFRTFQDVEQPESEFVLRIRNLNELALFESDGGRWKIEAVKNIKYYFSGLGVSIIG